MITVLQNGSLLRSPTGAILDAHSSVTLIRSGDSNIIVDTGFPGDGGCIITALQAQGLLPEDISLVINTHGHLDHTGANKLFTSARFLMHRLEGGKTAPRGVEIEYADPPENIDSNVSIIHTPGHSRGCISIVIRHLGSSFSNPEETVVCAGDALPIHGNYIGWLPPGINYDRDTALSSMKRIVQIADWIIPGHDKPFRVDKK